MVKSFKGKIIHVKPEEVEEPDTTKSKPILPEANISKDEILASYIDQQQKINSIHEQLVRNMLQDKAQQFEEDEEDYSSDDDDSASNITSSL